MALFPVEINTAPQEMLLRVPGIGVKSAKRIVAARRVGRLDFAGLKKIGVVLKRAQFFVTCNGRMAEGLKVTPIGCCNRCCRSAPGKCYRRFRMSRSS